MTLDIDAIFKEDSDEAKRFRLLGFSMIRKDVFHNLLAPDLIVTGIFKCYCGRSERFSIRICTSQHIDFNIYKALEDSGNTSENHLRVDGYSEEVIEEIKKRSTNI